MQFNERNARVIKNWRCIINERNIMKEKAAP
jgi:hypothetical protein